MKTLSATLQTIISAKSQRPVLLVEFSSWGGSYVRFANSDKDVVYASDRYSARGCGVTAIEYGSGGGAARVSVGVDNSDLALTDLIDGSNPASRTSPALVTVRRVFLDNLTAVQTLAANLTVVAYQADSEKVTFECLGLSALLDKNLPRRKYGRLCPWEFKGTECTYSSSSTYCSDTDDMNGPHEYRPQACRALLNWDNYGGFLLVVPKRENM